MFFAKLLANRLFLLFLTLVVTSLVSILMVHELHLFFAGHSEHTLMELKEDEEGIAILLIGFGVLLEGRHILQNWIAGEEVEATATTHKCEYYGFILLSLGLFIEIFDQICNLIANNTVTLWMEILINYPINIYAMFLLVKVFLILADTSKDLVTE